MFGEKRPERKTRLRASVQIRSRVSDSSPAADGAAGAAIDAEVDVVEPMGAETYVYAAAEGASFIARVPSDAPVRAGTRARFLLDLSRASLFGPDGNSVL